MRLLSRSPTAPAALALACAALGAAAPAALGADGVVPWSGIAGVRLGDTPPAVRAELGAPASVRRLRPSDLVPAPQYVWRYPGREVRIFGGVVQSVSTRRAVDVLLTKGVATPGAPGVGSTVPAVRRWARPLGYTLECARVMRRQRVCFLGPAAAVGTVLRVTDGRVSEITVANVID